ncbi:MAG: BtpA/SgcQ family protein [Chloroflexota bacterium]
MRIAYSVYNFPAMFSSKPVIAVIHVEALPGTPANRLSLREIEAKALREAKIYSECGVHAVALENMHDVPYLRGSVGAEIVASMAIIARAVKDVVTVPCGIQILAGANIEAMAVAHAANLDFIRAEGFVFAHIADEGFIQSSAASLLRYRKQIGAERVQVWADVKKKHSAHAITSDIGIGATAEAVEFMRGDVVIVSGSVTGEPPQQSDILEVKQHCKLPAYLGSGVTADNLPSFFPHADGFIVGSYFKVNGHWANEVDAKRVETFMKVHQGMSKDEG